MRSLQKIFAAAIAALLAACAAPLPPQHPYGQVEMLLATDRPIHSVVIDGSDAYVALANSGQRPTGVLRSSRPLHRAAQWEALALGVCALAPAQPGVTPRGPMLKSVAARLYLYQDAADVATEQSLCRLDQRSERFVPLDDGLRRCGSHSCARLALTQLGSHGQALLSNAGGGGNVLASADQSRQWRPLLGSVAPHACPHGLFVLVGSRLLTAGQCAPGQPWMQAWDIADSGLTLAHAAPRPVFLPQPANRPFHFLGSAGSEKVFAGVDGGLLKSSDGGRSFRYVILHAEGDTAWPRIRHLLALRDRPRVLLAAGDHAGTGAAYLAVSRDGGDHWTDLSSILAGGDGSSAAAASVTSLAQDQAGRVVLSLALLPQRPFQPRGQLLRLTLGGVD